MAETPTSTVAPLDQLAVRWPVDIVDTLLSDERTGLRILQTWVASKRWVHRRVETITFLDDRRVWRHVSVDLTVPGYAPRIEVRPGKALWLLPLTVMRKRTLVNFDLRDREGGALTLPSVRQNQRLTFTLLQAWAGTLLKGQQLDWQLRKDLEDIAAGTPDQTEEAWKRLEDSVTSDQPEDKQRRTLMRDDRFKALIKRLKYCFLVVVAVEAEPLTRLLIKYSYERPIVLYWKRAHGPLPILARVIGAQPVTLEFPQPGAEFAQSYHWEIETPRGVDIVGAELRGSKWAMRHSFLDDSPPEHYGNLLKDTKLDGSKLEARRIDLHTVDVPPGSKTRGVLQLSPERGGWLQLSTIIAWLSALSLLLAAPRLPYLMTVEPGREARPDAIVLLFVTYALILEALLLKPGEHPLVGRLLRPFQRTAAVSGLLPLTASFLLVFWPQEGQGWQKPAWFALGTLGFILAAAQMLALWIIAPAGGGSAWTANAQTVRRGTNNQDDHQDGHRQSMSIRRRLRRALIRRETLFLPAGERNTKDDFYGEDLWNQRLQDDIEEAIRNT